MDSGSEVARGQVARRGPGDGRLRPQRSCCATCPWPREPGRVLAVTGPSGAGKTTLLWAMAGLVRPVSGSVTVGGVPLRNRDHAVAEQVVLVPQDNGLAPILTAGENVQVALVACGVRAARGAPAHGRVAGAARPGRPGRPARRGALRRPAAAHRDRPGHGPARRRAARRRGDQRARRPEPPAGARPAAGRGRPGQPRWSSPPTTRRRPRPATPNCTCSTATPKRCGPNPNTANLRDHLVRGKKWMPRRSSLLPGGLEY